MAHEDNLQPAMEIEAEAIAAIEADEAKPRSVVQRKYKLRYKERAIANGDRGRAAKRSNWDWLAMQLAGECLKGKKQKIDIEAFLAILEANGVDHTKWPNRSKGWEGRLRMTGGLALRTVVAETGILRLADGETLEAPAEFVAKHTN